MALVGGDVADVAAGRRDHVGAVDVQSRAQLLARGVTRDPDRPGPGAVLAATGEREFVDQPIGRSRVDEMAVGIGDRAGVGDLRAARPAPIPRRGEGPQQPAAARVDRDRAPIGGGDHDHVAPRSRHAHAVQVDRRGVNRAGQRDLLRAEFAYIGGGDPGRAVCRVIALRVQAELRPLGELSAARARCLPALRRAERAAQGAGLRGVAACRGGATTAGAQQQGKE